MLIAKRKPAGFGLHRGELGPGGVDGGPEGRVAEARGEVSYDDAEERVVARSRADGSVDALGDGRRGADAGVDGAGVGVAAGVGLEAAEHPFGAACEPVEIDVADDGVDRAGSVDELGGDHFGAGAVLGLGGEDEPRIAGKRRVVNAVVVIHPGPEAGAEPVDEGEGDGLKARAARLGGEGDIEDRDAASEVSGSGELSRGSERKLGALHVCPLGRVLHAKSLGLMAMSFGLGYKAPTMR